MTWLYIYFLHTFQKILRRDKCFFLFKVFFSSLSVFWVKFKIYYISKTTFLVILNIYLSLSKKFLFIKCFLCIFYFFNVFFLNLFFILNIFGHFWGAAAPQKLAGSEIMADRLSQLQDAVNQVSYGNKQLRKKSC